jgi:GNAT superfamily N-acetyltransferase
MIARSAEQAELDQLARIWYDGWQDAHARLLPAELARHRTLESFRQRPESSLGNLRVAGPAGRPRGLGLIKDDEVYQLYVAAEARGSGIAAVLMADAEQRIGALGYRTAWLTCAIGNARAARFYQKHGWQRVGNVINTLSTPDGPLALEVWRYEKRLGQ